MSKFTDDLMFQFIPKYGHTNNQGIIEIKRSDIESLKLNQTKRRELNSFIRQYQIKVIEEDVSKVAEITKRSPYVRDLIYHEKEEKEAPVVAEVTYSEASEVIESDFSELDHFIDKKFIPKYIRTKRVKGTKLGEEDFYQYIQLNKIVALKLSTVEFDHVINRLNELGIIIRGMNSTLDKEFDNYECIVTYKTTKLVDTLSWDETLLLFQEYKDTNRTTARDRIIESNMRLVDSISRPIAKYFGVDKDDLNGFGYIGLVRAVDNFDFEKGFRFSSYAYPAIRRAMLASLPSLLGFSNFESLSNYMMAKDAIMSVYEEEGIDREVRFEDVFKLLNSTNYYSDKKFAALKNEILLAHAIDIEECEEAPELIDDSSLYHEVSLNILKDWFMNHDDYASDRDIEITKKYYGVIGDGATYAQLGEEYNISGAYMRERIANVLRKLRSPQRRKALYDYIESLGEYTSKEELQMRLLP